MYAVVLQTAWYAHQAISPSLALAKAAESILQVA